MSVKVIDRTQPNPSITALLRYKNNGTLLDLGAGHGRHAVFFAEHGFEVTAVDPDPAFCKEVIDKSLAKRLKIDVVQSDIVSFPTDKEYDALVCAMVLHFLEHQGVVEAVEKLKVLTARGGLNVISAYTNQNIVDFMKDNPHGREAYLLKPGELKDLYEGWEILEYSEKWTEPGVINEGDVPKSYHKVNMIARKNETFSRYAI
jgi:tellurite methyltransferase